MGLKPRASVDDAERVEVTSRAQWRRWLADNHQRDTSIWLITYKKHCGDRHVPWGDIVREAICFGWIDSRTRRVDDDRTMVYVSPRRPGSAWSRINKQLVAELEAAKLLAPAGRAKIAAARRDGSWSFLDDVEDLVVPDDLAAALAATPRARTRYDAFRGSDRKRLLYWVKTAGTPETRARRIGAIASAAADGRLAC